MTERWDDLFADLDAQMESLALADRGGEVAERTRIELGQLSVGDRLGAAIGSTVRLRTVGGATVAGVLERVGADWVLVDESGGREAVVALATVVSIGGLGRAADVPGAAGAVQARLTMRHVLRGIARDRSAVRLQTVDGGWSDGTIDRVAADHVDLAVHAPGEPRRRSDVREVQLVPTAAIAVVRRSV